MPGEVPGQQARRLCHCRLRCGHHPIYSAITCARQGVPAAFPATLLCILLIHIHPAAFTVARHWNVQLYVSRRSPTCCTPTQIFDPGPSIAGIFVKDILDAAPIDKYFELFKPSAGGEGGYVRIGMDFVKDLKSIDSLTGGKPKKCVAHILGWAGCCFISVHHAVHGTAIKWAALMVLPSRYRPGAGAQAARMPHVYRTAAGSAIWRLRCCHGHRQRLLSECTARPAHEPLTILGAAGGHAAANARSATLPACRCALTAVCLLSIAPCRGGLLGKLFKTVVFLGALGGAGYLVKTKLDEEQAKKKPAAPAKAAAAPAKKLGW